MSEREGYKADRIMEEVRKEVDKMSDKALEKYAATRESEWKYWKHD